MHGGGHPRKVTLLVVVPNPAVIPPTMSVNLSTVVVSVLPKVLNALLIKLNVLMKLVVITSTLVTQMVTTKKLKPVILVVMVLLVKLFVLLERLNAMIQNSKFVLPMALLGRASHAPMAVKQF